VDGGKSVLLETLLQGRFEDFISFRRSFFCAGAGQTAFFLKRMQVFSGDPGQIVLNEPPSLFRI